MVNANIDFDYKKGIIVKAKHIIWIVVDSMRSYITGQDDRDKLEIMNEVEKGSITFTNALCSAPSSLMSIGAAMTSLPAYYLGVNYKDFKCDTSIYPSFPEIWKNMGYDFVSFLNSLETREVFDNLLFPVHKKYFTKDSKPLDKRWSNKVVNDVIENYLNMNQIKKNTCFFIWFNIREDETTTKEVGRTIELFKQYDIFNESFVIITADHGYLDPKRGYTPEKLKELNLTHDILVTEDQIKVPLSIIIPECKAKTINNTVSLIDIVPTLIDYFSLINSGPRKIQMQGKSLLPLISHNKADGYTNRDFRIDGRFMFQPGRITAIRNDTYKYVYNHDKQQEALYNICKDFFEETNLLDQNPRSKDILIEYEHLKKFFLESELEVESVLTNISLEKLNNKLKRIGNLQKIKYVYISYLCDDRYFLKFKGVCEAIFNDKVEYLINCKEIKSLTNNNNSIKIAIIDSGVLSGYKDFVNHFNELDIKKSILLNINLEYNYKQYDSGLLLIAKRIRKELFNIKNNPIKVFSYFKRVRRLSKYFIKAIKK